MPFQVKKFKIILYFTEFLNVYTCLSQILKTFYLKIHKFQNKLKNFKLFNLFFIILKFIIVFNNFRETQGVKDGMGTSEFEKKCGTTD